MPTVKISRKHQITVPKEVFSSLKLEAGDFLDTQVQGNTIILIPRKFIAKDQQWFWTKEWQEREEEADEAIASGEIVGPFETASEAIMALKKK